MSANESTNTSPRDSPSGSRSSTRAWLGLGGAVTAIVVIHLLALVVVPDGATALELGVLEGVTGLLVTGGLFAGGEDLRWAISAGVASASGASVTWLLATQTGLWQVAIGTAVLATVASYGLHRYELLTMGLLEETT
jgi:hypothetical protein